MASKPLPVVRAATSRAIHWRGLVGLRAAGLRATLGERPSCEQMRFWHLPPRTSPHRVGAVCSYMSRCRPGVRRRVALAASRTASGRSCERCTRTARVSLSFPRPSPAQLCAANGLLLRAWRRAALAKNCSAIFGRRRLLPARRRVALAQSVAACRDADSARMISERFGLRALRRAAGAASL